MLFAVKANCSTFTRTSPSVVEQRDELVFVRLMSASSTEEIRRFYQHGSRIVQLRCENSKLKMLP